MAMALSWRRISNKHIGFCGCNELFSTNALCQLQRQTQILSKYIPNFFFSLAFVKFYICLNNLMAWQWLKAKANAEEEKKMKRQPNRQHSRHFRADS